MPDNPIPAYRRQRRKNRADVAFVELAGKRHYLGEYGSDASREKYGRLIAEYQAGGNRAPVEADAITVVELIARYLSYADRYYRRPDGQRTSEYAGITASMKPLKAVREKLVGQGLARTTVNQRIKRIRRMFKWGVGEGLVPPMVHHGLTAIDGLKRGRSAAKETDPVKPVPDAYVEAVKAHATPTVAAMIEVQRLTGMRPAELCTMATGAIDTSGKVWTYTPPHHKTSHHGHERLVFIGPRAQNVLRPYLRHDLDAACFSPRESAAEAKRRDAKGQRRANQQATERQTERRVRDEYDVPSYRRAIHRACDRAGIPRWSPNRLRHNFATEVRRSHGIDAAQTALGHRMGSAVTEVYAEQNHERTRDIIAKVG